MEILSDLGLPMVEVNCTTDGMNNTANVTWKLKSLENATQYDIWDRIEHCRTVYVCTNANVSSQHKKVIVLLLMVHYLFYSNKLLSTSF